MKFIGSSIGFNESDSETCSSSDNEEQSQLPQLPPPPPPEPFVAQQIVRIQLQSGKMAKIVINMPPYEKGSQCRKCNHLSVDERGTCRNCCSNPKCDQQRRKIGQFWICPEGHCDWCETKTETRTSNGLCKPCDRFMKTECIGYS